jgi:hypothetical protein
MGGDEVLSVQVILDRLLSEGTGNRPARPSCHEGLVVGCDLVGIRDHLAEEIGNRPVTVRAGLIRPWGRHDRSRQSRPSTAIARRLSQALCSPIRRSIGLSLVILLRDSQEWQR